MAELAKPLFDRLIRALGSPAPGQRRDAVEALRGLRGERVLPALLSALEDPDAGVRWHAMLAIDDFFRESALDPVLACVARERDDRVLDAAYELLERWTCDERTLPIWMFLLENGTPKQQALAEDALLWLNTRKVRERLRDFQPLDEGARRRVLSLLAQLGAVPCRPDVNAGSEEIPEPIFSALLDRIHNEQRWPRRCVALRRQQGFPDGIVIYDAFQDGVPGGAVVTYGLLPDGRVLGRRLGDAAAALGALVEADCLDAALWARCLASFHPEAEGSLFGPEPALDGSLPDDDLGALRRRLQAAGREPEPPLLEMLDTGYRLSFLLLDASAGDVDSEGESGLYEVRAAYEGGAVRLRKRLLLGPS